MFKGEIRYEKKLCKMFNNWYIEHEKDFAKRNINVDWKPALRGKPIFNEETGEEDLYTGKQRKGEIVRFYLNDMYKEENGTLERVYDYVICIDGDNDIQFDNILRVLDVLMRGEKVCLSCRQGKFGLRKPRNEIERFELNILEAVFNKSIPDGQCGCWGMHHSIVKKLKLSAIGFEIELDVLINILKMGINPFFIDLEIKQEGDSEFNVKSHEEKLKFICEQLKITPATLRDIYSRFLIEYEYILPASYLMLEQFEYKKPDGKKIEIKDRKPTFKCEKPFSKKCDRCDRKAHSKSY
jgi:hypothetical protein